MGKVIYYLAMSVDGLIARPDGDLDWLESFEHGSEDYGYETLLKRLDALIMGAATYEWLLAKDIEWPYGDLDSIVMTRRPLPQPRGGAVRFTSEQPAELMRSLRERYQKDIWLVGGGKLAAAFAAADLIDEYDLTIIPVILGAGTPLLEPVAGAPLRWLTLAERRDFPSGVVRLRYERRT